VWLVVEGDATRVTFGTFSVDVLGSEGSRSMALCCEDVGFDRKSASVLEDRSGLSIEVSWGGRDAAGMTFDVFSVDMCVVDADTCVDFVWWRWGSDLQR
jgi:hypothetical protein